MMPQEDPKAQNSELISAVAVLSSNVASLTKVVESYQQLLYGEGIEGGLLVRVREDHRTLHDPELGLVQQVAHLARNCEAVVLAVKTQSDSVKRLNKTVSILAGITIFLLVSVGIADFKTVLSFILALV